MNAYAHTAAALERLGRNGDTRLVHMTDREVRALQGLGSLTINPHTGLPEASLLGDILPYVIGIGGSMMGLPTWALALGQGALSTAKTGSLTQGLMSGMLTAGLGSLAHGMMGGASDAASGAGGAGGAAGAVGDATQGAAAGATQTAGNTAASLGSGQQGIMGAIQNPDQLAAQGVISPDQAAQQGMMGTPSGAAVPQSAINASQTPVSPNAGGLWSRMQNNASNMGNNLSHFNYSKFMADPTNKYGLYAALGGQYGTSMLNEQAAQKAAYDAQNASSAQHQAMLAQQYQSAMANARKFNPYYNFAASGGLIGDSGRHQGFHQPGTGALHIKSDYNYAPGGNGLYDPVEHKGLSGLAEGGTVHMDGGGFFGSSFAKLMDFQQNPFNILGQYTPQNQIIKMNPNAGYAKDSRFFNPFDLAEGGSPGSGGIEGLLKGPGHGMSDEIPAHINGETPAALSNDEFVIPADVVSHLGNGSTSAGAEHLYRMMDRIRKARTGNPKQGKEIDAEKHLPA